MHHLTANLSPQLCPFSRSRPDGDTDLPIKQCPVCGIYIERNQGCAQMLCKSCKHTFCWYCLQNLDVSPPPNPTILGGEKKSAFSCFWTSADKFNLSVFVLCDFRVIFSWGIMIRGLAETSWDTPGLQLCGTEHRWGSCCCLKSAAGSLRTSSWACLRSNSKTNTGSSTGFTFHWGCFYHQLLLFWLLSSPGLFLFLGVAKQAFIRQ